MRVMSARIKCGKQLGKEKARRSFEMYRALITMVWPFGDVRVRTYWFYLRGLTVEG